jgi:hypothetical protein
MHRMRNQGNNPIYNSLKNNKVPWNKFNDRNQILFNENYKPLKREIKKDIRRWKDLPYCRRKDLLQNVDSAESTLRK